MSDILCAKCGEPQESYSLQAGIYKSGEGDLTQEEAERFLRGEGCPHCAYGEHCSACNGTGLYDEGRTTCPGQFPCLNGARLAWSPDRGFASYRATEFYYGYDPNVQHVVNPKRPPGVKGKGGKPVYIQSQQTLDGYCSEYWILCPDCEGALPPCTYCNGTGALKPSPHASMDALESELDCSDLDPIEIINRREKRL